MKQNIAVFPFIFSHPILHAEEYVGSVATKDIMISNEAAQNHNYL